MKRHVFTTCAAVVMLCASAFRTSAQEGTAAGVPQSLVSPPVATAKASTLTMNAPILDKTSLADGGEITITGKAPAGAKVFFEVYSADKKVRANQFDNKKDPKTGKPPYMFYLSGKCRHITVSSCPRNSRERWTRPRPQGPGGSTRRC